MTETKTILVYPIHPTSYTKFMDLSLKLAEAGIKVNLLVANEYVRERIKSEHSSGAFVILDVEDYGGSPLGKGLYAVVKRGFSFLIRALAFIKAKLGPDKVDSMKTAALVFELKNQLQVITRILDKNPCQGIVVAGDRHMQFEPALLKAARIGKIPSFIPPVSVGLNPGDKAKMRLDSAPGYDLSEEKDLRQQYPEQFINVSGRYAGFYESWKIRALGKMGMLSENPWVLGAGLSDYLMVRGEMEKREMIGYGLQKEKIMVTGDPEYDALYESQIKQKEILSTVLEEYGLETDKKIIVIALPQLYEHKLLEENEHWQVIERICEDAGSLDCHVLVSLHPKMDHKNYRYLEQKYGLVIVSQKLRDVLVLADIFVAGQGSSTWKWAVLCGMPMVVCDWYGLDYEMHQSGFGIDIVKEASAFLPALKKLLDDKEHYLDQQQKQLQGASQISLFDGRANKRIIDNILSHT